MPVTKHLRESTFWYYLGHRVWDDVTGQIAEAVIPMNVRAREEGIPVVWKLDRAVPWAAVCRVYVLSKQHFADATQAQFRSLRRGCSASIQPRGFFDQALKRVLGNINEPALPNREPIDSLADTFAAASMNYTIPDRVAESIHPSVLEWIVADQVIHTAALLAVTPEEHFWDECTSEYGRRRPGWIRRTFSNAATWLFGR